MFPPGLEPGTFRVLGERDNHYTTETEGKLLPLGVMLPEILLVGRCSVYIRMFAFDISVALWVQVSI